MSIWWDLYNLELAKVKYVSKNYQTTRFFNKQHSYKQRQTEIGKKLSNNLSNALWLNFHYSKIIRFLRLRLA